MSIEELNEKARRYAEENKELLSQPGCDIPMGSSTEAEEYRNTMILFHMLKREYLYRIKKAIEDAEFLAHGVDESDRFILNAVENILYFQPEKKQEIAKIFDIEAGSLDKLQLAIAERVKQEDSECLPGLEPSKEDRLAKASKDLFQQINFVYPVLSKRGSSELDRRVSVFHNSGNDVITLDELSIKWNITNGAKRITPFDQEVELAVSNIVEQSKQKPIGEYQAANYEQIYCVMNGINMAAGTHISQHALDEIRDSVQKLNATEIEITAQSKAGTAVVKKGRILDAVECGVRANRGRWKTGVKFSRVGLLYELERDYYNRLLSVTREQLNIGAGYIIPETGEKVGITVSSMTVIIRRYLLIEIFRIKNTPSIEQGSNTVTYDAIIKYEADPALVEYSPEGVLILGADKRPKLKVGNDRAEQKKITRARKSRRDFTIAILRHFKQTGLIRDFSETTDSQKRKHGVVLDVDKTEKTLRKIKKAADLKKLQG